MKNLQFFGPYQDVANPNLVEISSGSSTGDFQGIDIVFDFEDKSILVYYKNQDGVNCAKVQRFDR